MPEVSTSKTETRPICSEILLSLGNVYEKKMGKGDAELRKEVQITGEQEHLCPLGPFSGLFVNWTLCLRGHSGRKQESRSYDTLVFMCKKCQAVQRFLGNFVW